MKDFIFIIIIAVSLGLALYFYRSKDIAQDKLERADRKIAQLEGRNLDSRLAGDTSQNLTGQPGNTDTIEMTAPGSASFTDELGTLSSSDISYLNRKGLKNPEADLKNDMLRKQSSLIPQKGTLGGTMQIRDIRILNDRYALAYYEDGHIGGYMLLRYDVYKGGGIAWTVLDSHTK